MNQVTRDLYRDKDSLKVLADNHPDASVRGNGGAPTHILGPGLFRRPSVDFLDQECKVAYGSRWRVWEAEHWQEWLYAVWAGNCKFAHQEQLGVDSGDVIF